MEIILLRHGKPDFSAAKKVTIAELHQMIAAYNLSGVTQPAPDASVQMAQSCDYIVCSDLPRSIQSAQLLGLEQIHRSELIFREADLPVSVWPSPRMSVYFWFALFRIIWFFGHRAGGESIVETRSRAASGMRELSQLAKQHGRVLFVGHGVLNQFIAKELLSYGWRGPKRPARHHWGYSRYTLTD